MKDLISLLFYLSLSWILYRGHKDVYSLSYYEYEIYDFLRQLSDAFWSFLIFYGKLIKSFLMTLSNNDIAIIHVLILFIIQFILLILLAIIFDIQDIFWGIITSCFIWKFIYSYKYLCELKDLLINSIIKYYLKFKSFVSAIPREPAEIERILSKKIRSCQIMLENFEIYNNYSIFYCFGLITVLLMMEVSTKLIYLTIFYIFYYLNLQLLIQFKFKINNFFKNFVNNYYHYFFNEEWYVNFRKNYEIFLEEKIIPICVIPNNYKWFLFYFILTSFHLYVILLIYTINKLTKIKFKSTILTNLLLLYTCILIYFIIYLIFNINTLSNILYFSNSIYDFMHVLYLLIFENRVLNLKLIYGIILNKIFFKKLIYFSILLSTFFFNIYCYLDFETNIENIIIFFAIFYITFSVIVLFSLVMIFL